MDKIKSTLDQIVMPSLMIIKSATPYRSGVLSRSWNARITTNGFELYNSTSYLPYVNEKWVSPQWRGRANPNEDFIGETVEVIARFVASQLGGTYVSNR